MQNWPVYVCRFVSKCDFADIDLFIFFYYLRRSDTPTKFNIFVETGMYQELSPAYGEQQCNNPTVTQQSSFESEDGFQTQVSIFQLLVKLFSEMLCSEKC